MARLQGILRQEYECGDTRERIRWLIEHEEGRATEVKYGDDALLNQPVEADIADDGSVQSMTRANTLQTVVSPPEDDSAPDKTMALFKVVPIGYEPTAQEVTELAEIARKVHECYHYTARGRWHVGVEPYFLPANCNAASAYDCRVAIDVFRDEHDIEARYNHTWGGQELGYCGRAHLCQSNLPARTYSYCGASTVAHEGGHAMFCERHAGKRRANGFIDAYGDNDCFMGSGNLNGLNAAMQYQSGLHNKDGFVDLTESRELHIAPIEWDRERHPGESQVVRIERNDYYLFISRRKFPYPYGARGHVRDRVFVHRTKSKVERNTTYLLEELAEGETFNEDGVEVRHEHQGRDVSRVTVSIDGGTPQPSQPPAVPALPTVEIPLSPADIGYWYDPMTTGQGYELFVIPPRGDINYTQVVMFAYTYNFEGTPKRVWYMCDGKVVNGVGDLKVYETSSNGANMRTIGTVRVYREGDRLCLDWDTTAHGRAHIRLVSLLGSENMVPEWTGIWNDKSGERRGFTTQCRLGRFHAFRWDYSGGAPVWHMIDGGSYNEGDTVIDAEYWQVTFGKWNDPRPVGKNMLRHVQFRLTDAGLVFVDGADEIDLPFREKLTP